MAQLIDVKRQVRDHVVSEAQSELQIQVLDEPGQGGACHVYRIGTPVRTISADRRDGADLVISFQNGPIKEAGVNGVTQEALLAVVIDRLRGFQSGEFSCRENAVALTHCETALMWLQKRTRDRMGRGVEGTNRR